MVNASPRLPRAPLRTLEAVHLHLIVCGAYGLVTSAAGGHPSEGIHAGLGILLGPTLVKVGRGVNAGMSRRTSANMISQIPVPGCYWLSFVEQGNLILNLLHLLFPTPPVLGKVCSYLVFPSVLLLLEQGMFPSAASTKLFNILTLLQIAL